MCFEKSLRGGLLPRFFAVTSALFMRLLDIDDNVAYTIRVRGPGEHDD